MRTRFVTVTFTEAEARALLYLSAVGAGSINMRAMPSGVRHHNTIKAASRAHVKLEDAVKHEPEDA